MRKIIIILAVAAALCFAGLWGYVQSDDFERRIRPYAEAPLRKALGKEARIGRIKAHLFPLSLEVRDLAVGSPAGNDVIAIRKVTIYLNPFPLLIKTISLSSISILEPRLEARRDAAGEIDLLREVRRILDNAGAAGGGAPSSWAITFGTLSVRNGTARFTDAGTGIRAVISRLNMKASSVRNETAHIRLSSGTLSISSKSYPERTAALHATAAYEHGRISVDTVEIKSNEGRFIGSGTVDLARSAMNLKASLRIGGGGLFSSLFRKKSAFSKMLIDTECKITGPLGDPNIEGTVKLSDIPLGTVFLQKGSAAVVYRNRTGLISGTDWEIAKGRKKIVVQALSAKVGIRAAGIDVIEALVRTDDAFASASGRIDSESGYRLAFTVESSGAGTTLAAFAGFDITGHLSLRGTLSGPFVAPEASGTLSAGPIAVRGVPFQAVAGVVLLRDRKLHLEGMTIRQDSSRYLLDGSVDMSEDEPRYDARLRVIKSDVVGIVALFYKRIPLDLDAEGELRFSGTNKEFSGSGRLALGPGVAYGEPFDNGTLAVELSSTRVTFSNLTLLKKQGVISGTGWIGFDGTYAAHVESAGVDLSEVKHLEGVPVSGPVTLDIRSSGSFSEPLVKARAESPMLSIRTAAMGKAFCDLEIRNGTMSVTALMEREGAHAVGLRGNMRLHRPYPWSLHLGFESESLNLAGLAGGNELLERLNIAVQGEADLQGQGGDGSSLRGAFRLSRLRMTLGDYRLENEGDGLIRIEGGGIQVRALSLAGTGTKLAVSGMARPGDDIDLALVGDANLSLLRLLYREIEHGDGVATLSIRIRDRWSNPDINGDLTVRNGQIKIKDVPQKFTSLNGSVIFDRGGIVCHGLTGAVGGGTVTVSGSAILTDASLRDFSAKAVVDNVTVRYPQGLTAVLGGSLFYDGDRSVQNLSGEVVIRRAHYEKRVDWKSMLVDFRAGFARKKKTDIGWIGETQLNVRFSGKESIVFESNLAKIPIDAEILIRGTVNQPQVLGRLEARKGEVYFRKNVFRIMHASADFADPNKINPVLDVQAETRVREYDIRLSVTGTADRSFVSFVSDPPLTDSNILALLTIGRKSEEVRGKEAGVGVGEATSFMTGKFQDIIETRARSLTGLDRFQVDPYISKTDVSVPRVTVGKEVVQDKVFMTYSSNVGATTPEQLFRIEYLLNRNMSLVGERDETGNIGADLKFRFEFR